MDLNQNAQDRLEQGRVQSDQAYIQSRNAMMGISAFAIFLCSLLGFFILRAVNKSINRIINELSDNANQVSSAARQIAESSQSLSEAATEQASSLEETSSSIEEISSMVKRNSENANSSAQSSKEGQESSEEGKKIITRMIDSMKDINSSNENVMSQVNESNESFSEIVKVIEEMGEKTQVINDIVFQTKLLSFNASVEAARAGEHGKGFAVVAEEVGNLAQMSGKAATEISQMLEVSTKKVHETISENKSKIESLLGQGKEKIDHGVTIAQECGDALDEIVNQTANINEMVKSIATASSEQSEGIGQVTQAVTQLDEVTQVNTSTSEEAASAAEELSGQADNLNELVTSLVTTIKGGSASKDVKVEAPRSQGGDHHSGHKEIEKASTNKVLHLKAQGQTPSNSNEDVSTPFQKAVGHPDVPSEDDPRFKDL